MRRLLLHCAILLAILIVPPSGARATSLHLQTNCPAGQAPLFAPVLANLREQLGPIMGEPLECVHEQTDVDSVIQRTTTGLAVYRSDTNVATFTNGREHWSLTPRGVVYGTGWHGSADLSPAPVGEQIEEAQQSVAPIGSYPLVEVATVVRDSDVGEPLVVQHAGTSYVIETDAECAARWPPDGGVVFVVSSGAFAGPDSWLIIGPTGAECRITHSRPL